MITSPLIIDLVTGQGSIGSAYHNNPMISEDGLAYLTPGPLKSNMLRSRANMWRLHGLCCESDVTPEL